MYVHNILKKHWKPHKKLRTVTVHKRVRVGGDEMSKRNLSCPSLYTFRVLSNSIALHMKLFFQERSVNTLWGFYLQICTVVLQVGGGRRLCSYLQTHLSAESHSILGFPGFKKLWNESYEFDCYLQHILEIKFYILVCVCVFSSPFFLYPALSILIPGRIYCSNILLHHPVKCKIA